MDGRQTEIGSLFNTIGDFRITDDALDAANEQMGERTNRSQRQDRRQRAPVTTDYQTWASDTDHWDFPSVDTPRQDPRVKPKDLKQSKKPRTTDPNTGEVDNTTKDLQPMFQPMTAGLGAMIMLVAVGVLFSWLGVGG